MEWKIIYDNSYLLKYARMLICIIYFVKKSNSYHAHVKKNKKKTKGSVMNWSLNSLLRNFYRWSVVFWKLISTCNDVYLLWFQVFVYFYRWNHELILTKSILKTCLHVKLLSTMDLQLRKRELDTEYSIVLVNT